MPQADPSFVRDAPPETEPSDCGPRLILVDKESGGRSGEALPSRTEGRMKGPAAAAGAWRT